jgi:hypothetical protein
MLSLLICAVFFLSPKAAKKPVVEAKVFSGVCGWGYDILVNDKLFIRQESVPTKTGSKGFALKEEAEKTARLIINKIENGQPPVVTTFELQKIISPNTMRNDE